MIALATLLMAVVALAICVTCSTRRIGPDDWRFYVFILSPAVMYVAGFLAGFDAR